MGEFSEAATVAKMIIVSFSMALIAALVIGILVFR